ncbi:unnamed protein product, partial [Prorocentrum cordatum]
GRVPLAKFYGTGLDADWRFAESEAYLRDLGALDETSSWRGKQVIIANYIQAASNCIVSTSHYLVCCANDCESLLGEVEAGIGQPVGTPDEILLLIGNMTSQVTLDDDDAPHLTASLRAQLEEIASAHGGQVPIHGRLFAQWLHYAFPRTCPFPHKAGSVSAQTPTEFGDGHAVSSRDMQEHGFTPQAPVDKEDLEWMSQWSSEEELIADYKAHLSAPWQRRMPAAAVLAAALAALAALGGGAASLGKAPGAHAVLPTYKKGSSHLRRSRGAAHFCRRRSWGARAPATSDARRGMPHRLRRSGAPGVPLLGHLRRGGRAPKKGGSSSASSSPLLLATPPRLSSSVRCEA